VLFSVPSKILTEQHHELHQKMTGKRLQGLTLTGEKSIKERIWDNEDHFMIVATPETIRSDLRRHPDLFANFNRMIFDEGHHAVGNYAYVEVARLAWDVYGIPTLTLTASPGNTPEKIAEVMRNCRATHLLWVERPDAPERLEHIVVAEQDETLRAIDPIFGQLLQRTAIALKAGFLSLGHKIEVKEGFITEKELGRAKNYLLGVPQKRYEGLGLQLLMAKYRMLRMLYDAVMTECYETFEALVREHILPGKWYTKSIRDNVDFQNIRRIVHENPLEHPKVAKFVTALESTQRMGWRTVTMFRYKETVLCLQKKLSDACVSTETIFGGLDRNVEHQAELLQKLRTGEISSILATSVLREGVNVPELECFIHYSLPQSAIEKIQGDGRTGRTYTGHVIYPMLNHPLEKARFWVARDKVARMKEYVTGIPRPKRPKRRRAANMRQNKFAFTSDQPTGP